MHGPEERKRCWSGAYPGRTSSIARESGSHLGSGSRLTRFHALCRSRYARVPFEFACCLLFSVPKASQPRFAWLTLAPPRAPRESWTRPSTTLPAPGRLRAGGAVRGAGGRRAEAPAGGRDSLGPLGRPSRVLPQLRADGFEAAGAQSGRHHVYGVMFTAYLAPRGCGDWDTPFAYPPGVPHESQA